MPGPESPYPSEFFRRVDESPDPSFYVQPRLVVHIDDPAIAAIREFLRQVLPIHGAALDLMSSWRSHLPEGIPLKKVVGLGLNSLEMQENPQLHERVVHDINASPILPFDDAAFDVALITVSIQYITHPLEMFRELARTLKENAPVYVFYSNRMFPTKAVAIWQSLGDKQRAALITSYFNNAGGWTEPRALDLSPQTGVPTDPLYVVTASRRNSS